MISQIHHFFVQLPTRAQVEKELKAIKKFSVGSSRIHEIGAALYLHESGEWEVQRRPYGIGAFEGSPVAIVSLRYGTDCRERAEYMLDRATHAHCAHNLTTNEWRLCTPGEIAAIEDSAFGGAYCWGSTHTDGQGHEIRYFPNASRNSVPGNAVRNTLVLKTR